MKRNPLEEMLERVVRRAMPNDEDGAGVNVLPCLTKPSGDSAHYLLVAFTVGERIHKMSQAPLLDLRRWLSRQITVVAFTKPSIPDNRKRALAERDLGGAERAGEIRAEYDSWVIVTPTRAEHTGLLFAGGRQGNVEPAGGETNFIVEACRVTFEDEPHWNARRERHRGS
ncbi:MAG TPA: hypothetical protein VM846_19960 [Vicinamibacterales bacterium]|nr:hypothetical protein [Vicinamibacterales bacterium]